MTPPKPKSVIEISNHLNDAIRALLVGIGCYFDLDVDGKKAVRHQLYQRLGKYAKIVVPVFDDLFEHALDIGDADHASDSSTDGGTPECGS